MNPTSFWRHLGLLVRDCNICTLRVHSWVDIEEHKLEHMWKVVTGGKDGNPPDMATIFFETRKKDKKLVEPKTIEKYVEIQELVQFELSLTNIEVVERCFGPQCKSHAVGFESGITAKELKGSTTTKVELLEELKATRKEKESLQERMDILESKYERLESLVVH